MAPKNFGIGWTRTCDESLLPLLVGSRFLHEAFAFVANVEHAHRIANNGTLKPAAELTSLPGARGITPEAAVVNY